MKTAILMREIRGYPENGYDNGYPYQENGYMPYQQVGYDEKVPDPQNSGPDLYVPDRGYGMNEYDEETAAVRRNQ